MEVKPIKCKCCGERGFPKNNSTIGYYCEKSDCQAEKKKESAKKVNAKFNQQPIRKVSIKLSKEQAIYRGKRIIFLAEKPYCERVIPECTGIATTIHHKKGRTGALLNDETHWIGLCLTCHKWVTEHSKEAIDLGYSISRLSKTNLDN